MVAFDTRNGTGDEVACVKFLKNVLEGFDPDKVIMETVARSRGKSDSAFVLAQWGTPKVLLNVHIDTVPSGEGWQSDPLALRREGDKVIGLGTSDITVSYTHLRAHETLRYLVCRLLLEKKK